MQLLYPSLPRFSGRLQNSKRVKQAIDKVLGKVKEAEKKRTSPKKTEPKKTKKPSTEKISETPSISVQAQTSPPAVTNSLARTKALESQKKEEAKRRAIEIFRSQQAAAKEAAAAASKKGSRGGRLKRPVPKVTEKHNLSESDSD